MTTLEAVQRLIDTLMGSTSTAEEQTESKSSLSADKLIKDKHFDLLSTDLIDMDKYKRILLIGMGGGSDVFSAYAYYKYLSKHLKSTSSPTLFFGNCTGIRDALKSHNKVSNYLYEIRTHREFEEKQTENHWGTTRLYVP